LVNLSYYLRKQQTQAEGKEDQDLTWLVGDKAI